jgi:RES domain-containing protein
MRVYRLSRKKYPDHLSGKGAATYGARWNPAGIELVYTADSRALAMAEVSVHLSLAMMPDDFIMITIEIPSSVSILAVEEESLPEGWNDFPYNIETQSIGSHFVSGGGSCVLKVPSAVVQGDFNYLINPVHADFKRISTVAQNDFLIDRRFFNP